MMTVRLQLLMGVLLIATEIPLAAEGSGGAEPGAVASADVSGASTEAELDQLLARLLHGDSEGWLRTREIVARIRDPRAIDHFLKSLDHHDPDMRVAAIIALSLIIDSKVVGLFGGALQGDFWAMWFRSYTDRPPVRFPHLMEAIAAALDDESAKVRRSAADALAAHKDPFVHEYYLELLLPPRAEDPYPRRDAARILGLIGSPMVVPQLVDRLDDESALVRKAIADSLGMIRDPRAVEPLAVLLTGDVSSGVREAAARALGEIGDPGGIEPLAGVLLGAPAPSEPSSPPSVSDAETKERVAVAIVAAAALGKIGGPQATDYLIAALQHENGRVQSAAADALGDTGHPRVVDHLVPLLRDEKENVRCYTLQALQRLAGLECADALVKVIVEDEILRHRRLALRILRQIDDPKLDPRSEDALIETLASAEDPQFREVAAASLGEVGDPRVVEPLIAALEDADREVQGSAITALSHLRDERAVKPLISLLDDPDPKRREEVACALGEFADPSILQPLLEVLSKDADDEKVAPAVLRSLAKLGSPAAVDSLIASLQSAKKKVRIEAISQLTLFRYERGFSPLCRLVETATEEWDVRVEAAKGLVRYGRAEGVNSIVAAVTEDEASARSAGSGVPARQLVGSGETTDILVEALRNGDYQARQMAAIGLCLLRDRRAMNPLIRALDDEHAEVRAAAASALGELRDPGSINALMRTLRDGDYFVCCAVERSLVQIGEPCIVPLMDALMGPNEQLRQWSSLTLGKITGEKFGHNFNRWIIWWEERNR